MEVVGDSNSSSRGGSWYNGGENWGGKFLKAGRGFDLSHLWCVGYPGDFSFFLFAN